MRTTLITLILIMSTTVSAYTPTRQKPVREYVNREYEVTAYTPDPRENGGYTTDWQSRPLRAGIIACDDLPDGTKVIICGKTYIVRDIFGGGHKRRIDILMLTKDEAYEWGRQKIIVQVIKE